MRYAVTKKVFPLFLLLMTVMAPLCSAESWQLIGREDGSDRDYYVDFDSTWYNGVLDGGGLTKVRSTETGFSAILTLKFQNNQDGTFDVTFTNGKAYDADGKLLYGSDLNLQHHSVTGAILSKVCQAMMDMSTARI